MIMVKLTAWLCQARALRLLTNVYLDWDSTEHYDKALNAADLANAVSDVLNVHDYYYSV